MSRRFDYVKYDHTATMKQDNFKSIFLSLEAEIESLEEGRAKSLALTHLEITYMWIGKALRDECIKRNPTNSDVPERTNN